MNKVRRAHSIDLALCEDEACGMMHIVLCDEKNDIFAEGVFDPTEQWLGDFMNSLLEICFVARMRQRALKTRH